MKSYPYLEAGRAFAADIGDDRSRFLAIDARIRAEAVNTDEALVPEYTLPSPLVNADGSRVTSASEWMNFRRPEVLELYERGMYGEILPRPDRMTFEVLSEKDGALDGSALRREVRITCAVNDGRSFSFDLLLYVPKNAQGPVPAFLGLNFKGNHGCTCEPDVMMTPVAFDDGKFSSAEEARAFYGAENMLNVRDPRFYAPESRGIQAGRWCFEEVVRRGYAAATVCYEDIFPDNVNGWEYSCLSLFGDFRGYRGSHEKYTAIGAWAWGLSRALDYLETCPEVDAARVCVHGHSRLGKTALWAGASDSRFGMAVSNDSGCGGAAISRRVFGENWLVIVNYFPHWFVSSARRYMADEDAMPFDQHFLISLMAPRPVAVASASEDLWADPRGEFLGALNAGEVYALFGSRGLPCREMPGTGVFVTGDVSYHIRSGKHNQTPEDWAHYLEIADRYLRKIPASEERKRSC